MTPGDYFQGVVCCCMDTDRSVNDTINKLLDLKTSSIRQDITCFDLELKNKYYQTTIHLFDHENLTDDEKATKILENCHAVILYGNGQKLTTDQLDQKLEQFSAVVGEPRILLFDRIDVDSEPHRMLLVWCIQNGYDFIDASDNSAQKQLIDSLSAYKWTHRSDETDSKNTPKLDDELIKKLMDFDSLLGKLSEYRDRPELRGNSGDKNIVEIAEILSGLLGDDVDNFLANEEGTHERDDS